MDYNMSIPGRSGSPPPRRHRAPVRGPWRPPRLPGATWLLQNLQLRFGRWLSAEPPLSRSNNHHMWSLKEKITGKYREKPSEMMRAPVPLSKMSMTLASERSLVSAGNGLNASMYCSPWRILARSNSTPKGNGG